MIMRRRPLLRAAVVGGGAYLAGKNAARREQEQQYAESMQDQRISDQEHPASAQSASQVPAQGASSVFDQLSQLSALHDKGALTDEEFSVAKGRLLGRA